MGKSFRKNNFTGRLDDSEKYDKQKYNRKMRRENKRRARLENDDYVDKYDVSDTWTMAKDGKMRFDADKYPKLRRK